MRRGSVSTDKPEVPDQTDKQLNSAMRLVRALATTLGKERGAGARETKLALRAFDALDELQVVRELKEGLQLRS
jgi:hypothetical protein